MKQNGVETGVEPIRATARHIRYPPVEILFPLLAAKFAYRRFFRML